MPPPDAATTMEAILYPAVGFGALCFVTTFASLNLPAFKSLEWDNRFFVAVTMAALLNASSVSYSSVTSLLELFTGPKAVTADCGPTSIVTAAAPSPVIYACW